jgi:hypothetical protein
MSRAIYEIRIRGAVGSRTASAFEGMEVRTETVLRGAMDDQAALHGVLDRLRDLGLELLDVSQVSERE